MNVYDSEIIASLLEGEGYVPTADMDGADVVVFNTCCIRDNADQKVYGRLGDFKRLKRSKPDQVVVVAGCLAQKDKEALAEAYPQVDIVLGTHQVRHLPNLLQRLALERKQLVAVEREGNHLDIPANPACSYAAMVPISVGCNQWCTYCIVPYVRGPLKSRPLSWVEAEVRRLVSAGHSEIMLLGQNVNDYGRDFEGHVEFADLLDRLHGSAGLRRLRFTSPHPAYFSQRTIDSMADNPCVCEHVHLPLQAGDDEILKIMRRGYTGEGFLDLVGRLRTAMPDIGLTTDIIVGFAGETEEQFQHTLDVVRAARFDSAFMFAYSERPGTPGAKFANQVPEEVRMERLYRLIETQNEISEELNRERVGRVVEVLAEGSSKKDPTKNTGRTRQHWLVHFDCEQDLSGQYVQVRLDKSYMWGFVGTRVEG